MLTNKHNSDKINSFLYYLMNLSYNKKCADCEKAHPSWADISHSFFICYECSSLHRRLGVNKSIVKSVQLDSWNIEDLRRMYIGGNKYSYKLEKSSDISIKYKDTTEFKQFLDKEEIKSRKNEPGEKFMEIDKHSNIKKEETVIEKKIKPKFSDFIESSSESEENENKNKNEAKNEIKNKEISEEEEKSLIFSKSTPKFKKSVNTSRSPFSFTIKEHKEDEK